MDADGVPDIIAGSRFNDTAGSDFGSAVVVSGATGLPLFTFFGPSGNSRFGEAVGAPATSTTTATTTSWSVLASRSSA